MTQEAATFPPAPMRADNRLRQGIKHIDHLHQFVPAFIHSDQWSLNQDKTAHYQKKKKKVDTSVPLELSFTKKIEATVLMLYTLAKVTFLDTRVSRMSKNTYKNSEAKY